MKNQTKAILASTMILALALSSVAGVTYSWFSDTEESEFEFATGTINIDASLENTTTRSPSPNLGIANIVPVGDTTYEYKLMVENAGSTLPAIVSAYVILERYVAFYTETINGESVRKSGEVYAKYNEEDKSIVRYETTGGQYGFFYSDSDRQINTTGALSFGQDRSLLKSSDGVRLDINPVYISGSDDLFTEKSATGKYEIRYYEYKYYIGDLVVNPTTSGDDSQTDLPTLNFSVNYRSDYKNTAVKQLYVRTTATQINANCHATQINYDPETSAYKASTIVDGTKPEVFLNSNTSIIISEGSLSGIYKIAVSLIPTSDSIKISIRYYDQYDESISIDPPGDLTIQFSYDNLSGIIKAPASKLDYTISIGGTS